MSNDTITTVFPDYPAAGRTVEVAPGVHWLSTPLPFRLRAINLYLLDDGDGWTIVDCGYSRPEVREQWERVWEATLDGRPVTRLVITHFHPDHAGNSAWICKRWGLVPWMTLGEWLTANLAMQELGSGTIERRLEFYDGHGLDAAQHATFRDGAVRYSAGVELPPAFRRLFAGDILRIGTRRWRVVVGQGHSPEHAALYCEDDGLLISGDQLLPEISTNVSVWPGEPYADPLALYLASLREFAATLRPDTLVLPSHRRPFRGAAARVRDLIAHHDERLARVLHCAAQGPVTAGSLLPHLFPPGLDGHQIGFAMGEALAHLNALVERGMLRRVEEGGRTRFETPA